MDSVNQAEKRIEDALASGELTPTRGVGEPFENLDADPAWWPKSLLARERAKEEFKAVRANRERQFAEAVQAADFSDARQILASLNHELVARNDRVEDETRLAAISEIMLLDERENARR